MNTTFSLGSAFHLIALCAATRAGKREGRRIPRAEERQRRIVKEGKKKIRTLFLTGLSGLDFPFTAISKVCFIVDPFSFYWYIMHCVVAATVVCSALNMILCQMARI